MKRLILILILCLPIHLRGDDVYQLVIQKQEKKAEGRWSLSQWLEQRDRMRLMDLWLALHSPSPYEVYFGGEYQFGKADGSVGYNANATKLFAAAYARIFGLEAQVQTRLSEWMALFHLRVFGYHDQATNITFEGGVRSRKDPTSYTNPLAGLSVTFYLFKNFGIGGRYRHFFGQMQNDAGIAETGNRFEFEAFVDFNFVRVYGQYFSELLDRTAGAGSSTRDRDGIALGTKIYF